MTHARHSSKGLWTYPHMFLFLWRCWLALGLMAVHLNWYVTLLVLLELYFSWCGLAHVPAGGWYSLSGLHFCSRPARQNHVRLERWE